MKKLHIKKSAFTLSLLLASSLFLSGCAGFFPSPYPEVTGTPKSYIIKGVKYQPLTKEQAEGFHEVGVASWYGPNFHGKQTANGEIYNQHLYTAAHRVLPLGTYIYVENLENGEVVRVRINDRGPFAHNRIIDLSRKAALELGMLNQGTARVRLYDSKTTRKKAISTNDAQVESLSKVEFDTSRTPEIAPPTASPSGNTFISIGSYDTNQEANKAADILTNLGFSSDIYQRGGRFYVESGPYASKKDAQNKLAVLNFKFPNAKVK